MKSKVKFSKPFLTIGFATSLVFGSFVQSFAQTPNAFGYSTGYGTVYGTFGLAQTMQSMYNVARAQSSRKNSGETVVQPSAARTKGSAKSNSQPPPRVIRNYGVFVPDPTVDTSKGFADALGDTPEERALIKQIYTATKSAFDKEAAARGWSNNIAAGLTFFTVTAVTVYHDIEEPNDEAVVAYFNVMNATLDELTELKSTSNKDKQNFNNMTVGFAGILLAGYVEAKQNNDREALAMQKKLAAMFVEMILKTDAENLRVENGRIVIK